MNYLDIKFNERYNQISQFVISIRETIYDLVEIPHLLEPLTEANFEKDVKVVAQALDYIVQNQPSAFSNQARQQSQQYFQNIITLQEEFSALEEAYYYNFYQIQSSSSPRTFKQLMQAKDVLQQYFFRQ
ncbi:hypothetical protein TTHERM_00713430 (macronuclear) [Tetrahymena thermophila SB210]|uniref:Uncharacterized protein n=1 Tax=Tetrahymena thermophila (strain SB210) TaxID=312017 RepID=Q24CV9_TETTS|nr:hypothetical protein TTHERM_00713430 [Tetrahymena thermophila SB210]EAS05649.1 hypothetical protein TTHERM_00713430 [Tetrahymena thermophila SB210]|eukprot:XP_001025894.1 hypothetical protein TTHERM_00713430 [Tetrahymena thermophila SB210]